MLTMYMFAVCMFAVAICAVMVLSIPRYIASVAEKNRIATFEALRQLARNLQLSERYGKGYAFHVGDDGNVAVVPAKEYLYAMFAGVDNFWKPVADIGAIDAQMARAVEELKRGDCERKFSVILNASGKTYLDAVNFPRNLPYPYVCSTATAEDFRKEIAEKSDNGECVHAGDYTTTGAGAATASTGPRAARDRTESTREEGAAR